MLKATVVIPARWGSVRFPGKVLMMSPEGKRVIQYTVEAALRAKRVSEVIVATDDDRVREAVEAFGGQVRMTSPDHKCGSDRVAEVAADLETPIIVNLQADEPGILPEQIDHCVELLQEDKSCVVSSLAVRIGSQEELDDWNVVKVVVDESWRALYFSRSPIPFVRDTDTPFADSPIPHLRHLGIYAYRKPFLIEYGRFGEHPLERAEKLEQLRALAHGYMIKIGLTAHRAAKVDTPEDFEQFVQELS
jgi:3-deoxy-manno-octulosonate cytidylyltransferase (CMP-KDO synthetase)